MSEIECQGTVSMAADPTPAEIIAKLSEDMAASPVDGVTVIDRGQLEVLSAALTPPPQDHVEGVARAVSHDIVHTSRECRGRQTDQLEASNLAAHLVKGQGE